MAVNGTVQLHAKATYADGTVDDFTTSSSWSSTNTSVATVGASTGVVTGQSPGSAQVGAQFPPLVDMTEQLCAEVGGLSCPMAVYAPASSGSTTPTVSISGSAYVPMVTGGSSGPNSTTLAATGTPSGGTYSWTTSSSKVSLTNTSSATVTYTSVAASVNPGDVPITVTYTLNGQPGTSTVNITVSRPTSLSVVTDTTNSTGHTCVGGTGTNTCSQSYFPGTGSYTSYVRNRTYHIMDQFNDWISGYPMQIRESYSTPTGQCSQNATPVTGSGTGDTIPDCFYFCSATCQSGGSCGVSSTQTAVVNGYTVATKSVTWTCSGVTVSP